MDGFAFQGGPGCVTLPPVSCIPTPVFFLSLARKNTGDRRQNTGEGKQAETGVASKNIIIGANLHVVARGLGHLNTASTQQSPLNDDDLSRFGLLGPDNREIDLGLKGDVKIVRQDVDRHMGDDFTNLRLRKPSLLHLGEIGMHDALHEALRRVAL
jgi:hypothetical protein